MKALALILVATGLFATFKVQNLSSFAEDANGELYLLAHSGDVFRFAG